MGQRDVWARGMFPLERGNALGLPVNGLCVVFAED